MVATAKTYSFILFLAFLFGCIGTVAHAGGVQEDPIEKAKTLIEAKLYNDAILILSEVMQNEPRRFDEAQQLVRQIYRSRGEYNEKYEELIGIYHEEELDLDRAYKIFEELEEMDKSPNKNTVEAFEKAKATAVFLYNKRQFEDIMERALVFLEEGKYWEACLTYLEGFDLYREEFENKDYSTLVKNTIERVRKELGEAAVAFQGTKDEVRSFFDQSQALLNGDQLERFRQEFSQYEETIRNIAGYRKEMYTLAALVQEEGERIQETYADEEFHLSYLYLLTMGRQESNETEGIIGSVDLFYADYVDRLSSELGTVFTQKLADGKRLFQDEDIPNGRSTMLRAKAYGDLLLENYLLWETKMYVDGSFNVGEDTYRIAEEKLPEVVLHQTRLGVIDVYTQIADEVAGLFKAYVSIPTTEAVPAMEIVREGVVSQRESLGRTRIAWEEEIESKKRIQSARDENYDPAIREAEELNDILTGYIRFGIETEQKAVVRIATIRYEPLITFYRENVAIFEEGVEHLEGYEATVGEGDAATTIELQDPRGAKERFEEVGTNLETLEFDFSGVISFLTEQQEYIVEAAGVREEIDRGEEYIEKINNLNNRIVALLGDAQEKILLAGRYKEEGYYRIDQARGELRRESFEEAREQLRLAGDRFDMSLAVQTDPELQEERDTLITELSDEINTTQNNVIVAEVRELIEGAKNYYTQEQYELAERNLLRAQSRWAITHVDSKPEIDYWLQIIRVALYVQSGREIKETDPLFAEMNQLLNLARENYLEGKRLAESGQREQANDYFEEAEKNILYVKIPFPLNQEASVLSLRILQYKNPDDFDELFRKRYNEAVAQIDTNPQQAYIDLKDLAAIRQNYPGIQNAIYRTEIELGMRIPPPDPAKQRKSDELYARALAIVQGGVRAQYPIALEFLNQAIKLTPQNQKVTTLLDRVEAELGGRTTTVLTNEAQQQYRLAEEKYIEGNYYEALRIVNNLLKDEQSSQYPPLLELKRRIESKI